MHYIYTQSNCPACESKKRELRDKGIFFIERDASRIKSPDDEADREALIQASIQNMLLPVLVELEFQND